MSGKPKQKQYQYSSLEDGLKFLRTFDSRQQVCDLYYDGAKMPFYQDGNIYYKLPNDTYICKERLGREGLRKAIRKWEDPNIYYRINRPNRKNQKRIKSRYKYPKRRTN